MTDSLRAHFQNIVVFDLETTGLNAARDQIIEFGAVKTDLAHGDMAEDECDLLIRLPAGVFLPKQITELTGITPKRLEAEGVSPDAACSRIANLLNAEGLLLIAYNAQFDLCFLYYLLKRYGREALLRRVKFLDAMTVYKDRRPYPHRLSDAVATYRLQTENTHRAIDDAKATLELIRKMGEEEDDLFYYINLFGFNPKYGISGQRISSVTYRKQGYDMKKKLYDP